MSRIPKDIIKPRMALPPLVTAAWVAAQEQGISEAKSSAQQAGSDARVASTAADVANQKATLADQKAIDAANAATLADQKAIAANQKAVAADQKADIAEQKAEKADQKSIDAIEAARLADLKANAATQTAMGSVLTNEEQTVFLDGLRTTDANFVQEFNAVKGNMAVVRGDLDAFKAEVEEDLDGIKANLVTQDLFNQSLESNNYATRGLVRTIADLGIYNILGNSNVTMERRAANNKVAVPHTVVTTVGEAQPGFGGVCHSFIPKPNTAYKVELTAQIPVGRSINMKHTNDIDAEHFAELTPMVGTGELQKYSVEIHAGANPAEGHSTGFYAIHDGDAATPENPLEWIITEANVYELPAGWE